MKQLKETRQRMSLTLLFSGLVFLFMVGTMLLVALILYLLICNGVLQMGEGSMRPGIFLLVMALFSIVIGTALAATAGRFPLRPLNGIIDAMNRLATGDFRVRLSYPSRLGKLAVVKELENSFNKMASELEYTELLREDFINNFSHEFKTPIVSIAGFARLLKKGNLSEAKQQEYLTIIEEESLRLSAMATNVLNLTRVENQTILTDISTYNLSEQLRRCVLLLENEWSKKKLELILDFKEYVIEANEELLEMVWLNLLDNAVKFTPDYGVVEVSMAENTDEISVSVINSGKEIPAESLDRIFQKFYQADESHAVEGNGIGLAIVKKIVELHYGQVSVDSSEGRTCFTLTLPKKQLKSVDFR